MDAEKKRPLEETLSAGGLSSDQEQCKQQVEETATLPMQPGDMEICHTLFRCGAMAFIRVSFLMALWFPSK